MGDSGGGWLTNLVHCVGILHYGWAWIWHASPMAGKRRRRLWDTYCFPGFRPEKTVRGIFGDPKARVITLKRRSKKRPAAVLVFFRFRPEPDYRTLDKAHQRASAESVSLSKNSDCRGSPKQSPKMGLASTYSAATLWTFFSAPRPSTGRSRALVNVRTTSSSTRPRISISWRGAAPRSTPARSATASEITSSQA